MLVNPTKDLARANAEFGKEKLILGSGFWQKFRFSRIFLQHTIGGC